MGDAAALVGQQKVYTAMPVSSDSILGVDGAARANDIKSVSAVLNGIDGRIDEGLAQLLANAVAEEVSFAIFPSFKGCPRNPEKLHRTINDLLNHDIAFVTPNYFPSNGCVARRRCLPRLSTAAANSCPKSPITLVATLDSSVVIAKPWQPWSHELHLPLLPTDNPPDSPCRREGKFRPRVLNQHLIEPHHFARGVAHGLPKKWWKLMRPGGHSRYLQFTISANCG